MISIRIEQLTKRFGATTALQHLDLDLYWDMWMPPTELIDKSRLKGIPQHGVGRTCKAGKEEIVGVLTALRLFLAEGDAARHARWLGALKAIADGIRGIKGMDVALEGAREISQVPILTLSLDPAFYRAHGLINDLAYGNPSVHVDSFQRDMNRIVINAMCLKPEEPALVASAIREAAEKARPS